MSELFKLKCSQIDSYCYYIFSLIETIGKHIISIYYYIGYF